MLSINEKLKNVLPVNLFLAACVLQIDHINGNLSVWIGAFPDLIIVGKEDAKSITEVEASSAETSSKTPPG